MVKRQNERVVDFLYTLIRDHLPAGIVEEIVANHIEVRDKGVYDELLDEYRQPPIGDTEACIFSNKGLEQYVRELTDRLHAYIIEEK